MTGHSLAGLEAVFHANHNALKAIAFNPGSGPGGPDSVTKLIQGSAKSGAKVNKKPVMQIKRNVNIYRLRQDAVSAWSGKAFPGHKITKLTTHVEKMLPSLNPNQFVTNPCCTDCKARDGASWSGKCLSRVAPCISVVC